MTPQEMKLTPVIIAKLSFWVGGILLGLAIMFDVFLRLRLSGFYYLQAPFGFLYLIVTALIIIVGIFILTNLYDYLDKVEGEGYFNPITKSVLLFLLFIIVTSVELIGLALYEIVRITGGTP